MTTALTMLLQQCMTISMLPTQPAPLSSTMSSVVAMPSTSPPMMPSPRALAPFSALSKARHVVGDPLLPQLHPPQHSLAGLRLHLRHLSLLLHLQPHLRVHLNQRPHSLLFQDPVHPHHHLRRRQRLFLHPRRLTPLSHPLPAPALARPPRWSQKMFLHPPTLSLPPLQLPCLQSTALPWHLPLPLRPALPPLASDRSTNVGLCHSTASLWPCTPPLMKQPAALPTWTQTSALLMSTLLSCQSGTLSRQATAASGAWMDLPLHALPGPLLQHQLLQQLLPKLLQLLPGLRLWLPPQWLLPLLPSPPLPLLQMQAGLHLLQLSLHWLLWRPLLSSMDHTASAVCNVVKAMLPEPSLVPVRPTVFLLSLATASTLRLPLQTSQVSSQLGVASNALSSS